MEVTLDTSGYKPDELKVEIKGGELCVEGKHEERSQSGEVMVSRQFSRRFGMPQNVKKEDIVSNLSQDGVMVVTMPKEQRIEEEERSKARTSPTKVAWTTLRALGRCRGGEEVFP